MIKGVTTKDHLVRLACIRHAASVRPEPGSNSPSRSSPGPFPPPPSGEIRTSFDRRAGACWSHDTDWRRHTVTLRTGKNPGGRPVCKFYELTAIAAWLGHGAIARTGFFVLSSVFK